MKKNSRKSIKTIKISEVLTRLTWWQRILYLLLPIVFLGVMYVNFRVTFKLSMEAVNQKCVMRAMEMRDAFEDYMNVANETIDAMARNVEYLQSEDASYERILHYFAVQTDIVNEVLAQDTTGFYGYINGEYVDSLWEPDEGYEPTERPWYKEAYAAGGDIVYVSPYVDMQTGEATVTVAKLLDDGESVVAIDFQTTRLQTIVDSIENDGEDGYAIVLDDDGTVVAHPDASKVGMNYFQSNDALGRTIVYEMFRKNQTSFQYKHDTHKEVIFTEDLGGSWYVVSVMDTDQAFKQTVRILVLAGIFTLIAGLFVVVFTYNMAASKIVAEDYSQNLDSLSEIYVAIYKINLDWDTYEEIACSLDSLYEILGTHGRNARQAFRKVISRTAAEGYVANMLTFVDFDNIENRLQNTETLTMEYRNQNGEWRRGRFIIDEKAPDGHLRSVLYLVEAIDEERRIREKLINRSEELERAWNQAEEARKEAENANLAKSHFLANMSHEIRTPINTVLGLDTMILRESKNETVRQYAMNIQSAGQSLLSIINDILDLSKIESGKMEIVPVEYDVAALINDVTNMVMPRAEKKGLTVRVEVDEMIPSQLFGDDVRVRQILLNLMTNAIKYTHEGYVTLSIGGEQLNAEEFYLYVSVKDTGIGIAKEDLDKLYQEFVRIEETRNRNIEGTGLGLNIVTLLLKLMGSKLEVDSVYGEGSEFRFRLIQNIVDQEPIGDFSLRLRQREVVYEHQIQYKLPDVKLLVVDDNQMNRLVFTELLKDFECGIDEAENGQQCLVLAARNKYDIIFMDHMMPEMDGIETFHRMREMKDCMNLDTPVIVLTANAISGAREEYLAEGFDDFLSKPVVPERLEKTILDIIPEEKKVSVTVDIPAKTDEDSGEVVESTADLPEVEGADWDYALLKLKKVALLKNVIHDFSISAAGDWKELEKYYEAITSMGDEASYSSYRIKVHSMKSTAAMMGAIQVSALAKTLEYAARDNNKQKIEAVHYIFGGDWLRLKEMFDEAFGLVKKEEQKELPPIEREVLIRNLDNLSESMESLDFDTADEIVHGLKEYGYPEKEEHMLEEIQTSVFNMDADECDRIISEWKALI